MLAEPLGEVVLGERARRYGTENLIDFLWVSTEVEALALEVDIHQDERDPLVSVRQRMIAHDHGIAMVIGMNIK